jgi:hypothetical protein
LIPVVDGVFSVEVHLSEGPNPFTITARDPANNVRSIQHRLILDTIPPVLHLFHPEEGGSVNREELPVSGSVEDANLSAVTVTVNGGPVHPLAVLERLFSGEVLLAPGWNTLLLEGSDRAGNTSRISRTLLLDRTPPSISLTTPSDGSRVSGAVDVSAEAADGESGIQEVTLRLDGKTQGRLSAPPFRFPWDTLSEAAGFHTLVIRAEDAAGNAAESSIQVEVLPQASVQVISPAEGTVVSQPPVIRGIVRHNLPEAGVVVNGAAAHVQGTSFGLAGLPLEPGLNTLAVTVSNGFDFTETAVFTLTVVPGASPESPVELSYTADSMLAPAEVFFAVDAPLEDPILDIQWDLDGDGAADGGAPGAAEASKTYPFPGLYFPSVTVIDSKGNRFTSSSVVNVMDPGSLEGLIQGKLNEVRRALMEGEGESALRHFIDPVRETYGETFARLQPLLFHILSGIEGFYLTEAQKD